MTTGLVGSFVYLVGLCVGSFLNVVIYRLPRGLSVAEPRWSFCPCCRATLRWYDNIPVVSWVLLRGRCRYCGCAVSPQYPLVEALTGLGFVLVYHLLFVAQTRVLAVSGTGAVRLAPVLPTDAPLLLAWLILVAVLVACSAMDLVLYLVDTRVTDFAMVAGIVLCAAWPRPAFFRAAAGSPLAAGAAVAFVLSAWMLYRAWRREQRTPTDPADDDAGAVPSASSSGAGAGFAPVAVVVGGLVALAVWLLLANARPAGTASAGVGTTFLVFFVAMVLTGGQTRAVDDDLHATIEAEAPESRREALRELAWLLPALLGGGVAYALVATVPAVESGWRTVVAWSPTGSFEPIGGAVYAIYGAILAAAAGWAIRILFTLAFGREAFGVGDIYILAAAGAAAGPDIALIGFLFSIPVALAGWGLSLLLKRSAMIPFGPPLALGFLLTLWLNTAAAETLHAYATDVASAWERQPQIVLMGVGLLIVALPIAVLMANLVRRLVEPRE